MELNLFYSIMGVLGGIVCAIGDILLDLKGKDNKKVGKSLVIESNWVKMANWRFKWSIPCGFFGSFMYSLGVHSLGRQIQNHSEFLSEALFLTAAIMAMCGFFIHSFICIAPIIYKAVLNGKNEDLAEHTINELLSAIKIIFGALFAFLLLAPTSIIIYCILNGFLDVPTYFVLLNPIVFLFVGLAFRAIKRDWFYDLPSIIMPSLGIGMFGVIGIVNLI